MPELPEGVDGSELESDNLPKRDASGYLLTDYSQSRMSPERQTQLRRAELDYVNGVMDIIDGVQQRVWLTLQEVADRHDLPVKNVNEASGKYKWRLRREEHKLKLKIYETEKQLQQRHVAVDKLTDGLVTAILQVEQLTHHVLWELTIKSEHEKREYARNLEAGNFDYVPNAGIRIPDLKGITDTLDVVGKTRDRLVKQALEEAQRLVDEPVAPEPMLTAVDEEKVKEQAAKLEREIKQQMREEGVSEIEVAEVFKELMKVEQMNRQLAADQLRVIQGEVVDDDDDESDDESDD